MSLLNELEHLSAPQLRRLLTEHLTRQKLGLYWEASAIERDAALNADVVLPRLVPEWSHGLDTAAAQATGSGNLIIEGDNFDSLRLLKSTHAHQVRVIYIDPPYNTGNKDWVYNDRYVGANDRWRHSQWLEFLYRRLQLAKDLLTHDGVILVSINDENRARLELLMDEAFPGRRVGSLVWKKRRTSNAAGVEHFFSTDHEHVLIYANPGFEFSGSEKDFSKYNQWDEQKQDWWTSTQLTLGFNKDQRKNLYYPLRDPVADIWYPCDPNRVWARATEERLSGRQVRTETMEALVAQNGVHFPDEAEPAYYSSVEEISAAVARDEAPPHLAAQEDLAFWVNKKIGYGKPRFKTYRSQLRTDTQPLSSWIYEFGKEVWDESVSSLSSGMTSEGTKVLRDLSLDESFPYPKPLSLIQNLLQQATRPGDTVLDFFAGSGTTGHAVLALNTQDDGNRKFILCSSIEATAKELDKNLCRDVCAERMRRVIAANGWDASFAYLQLDKLAPADVPFESTPAHAFALLTLRAARVARPMPDGASGDALQARLAEAGVWVLAQDAASESLTVLVPQVSDAALAALAALPLPGVTPSRGHLRVFSRRPEIVRQALQRAFWGSDKTLESLSLRRALWHGQRTPRRSVRQRGASDATQKIAGGADSAPTMGQNDSKEVV